ncbi:nucleotidyl transferase AbiEii/AbiGii toxin family protein [Nocardia uniformis]|uniref:Nucleotidyl transferase AbiEii/AbiGii toxin family protein n=1 Tax=Nocardia uniformis TaxID=53432 RepID=A0A849BTV3_9NOCA|nr:nucleotidyl transferase AbiEii/AbiGii toxin family protein [Nocardia uniformis]NNH70033.1 nucleotidyl transferase AbiEii/AbiGii toxin family protein [Nocardia uniformis]
MSEGARSPQAVRSSVTDHLEKHAKASGQSFNVAKRRFVMSRFLARVFAVDPQRWILKGGVGMMVRLPESRYSRDIDIMAVSGTVDPVADLRHAVGQHIDHFRFDIGPATALSNGKGATVTVTARIGTNTFETFSIDLVDWRRPLVGPVEHHTIPRVVDTDDFPPETTVQLYPLADQIADKICAMYELHGAVVQRSSGRYRDLVDLLLISMFLQIELAPVVEAVERERVLRGIERLPATLESPGPDWDNGWRKEAQRSPLPEEHHVLDAGLYAAGRCYNRVLAARPTVEHSARWNPGRGVWED